MQVLGAGTASTIVYGFQHLAIKVGMSYDALQEEFELHRQIFNHWVPGEGGLRVCRPLSLHKHLDLAAEEYGLPDDFELRDKYLQYPVMVMERIPVLDAEDWETVVKGKPVIPGVLRLCLGTDVVINERAAGSISDFLFRAYQPEIGWKTAAEDLRVDVKKVAAELGRFMAFLHFQLERDGADLEVQLGAACTFVLDFSLFRRFSPASSEVGNDTDGEDCLTFADVGREMRNNGGMFPRPGTELWTAFVTAYLANVRPDQRTAAERILNEISKPLDY